MFPMVNVPSELLQVCSDWHGGQTSAMYSVSSTGTIYNIDTLSALSCELLQCAKQVRAIEPSTKLARHWEKRLKQWETWCDEILDRIS